MRILVVAEQYPWPAVDGYRQRLDHVVRGLTRAGTVDVVALHRPDWVAPVRSPLDDLGESTVVEVPASPGAREWLPSWVRGRVPRRMLFTDWEEARGVLGADVARPDMVWFSHVDTWEAVHDLFPGVPSVVDFDNLEDLALRLRRRIPPYFAPGTGATERVRLGVRWATSRAFDVVDERRFAGLQAAASAAADRVVVCSELDVERSGCVNAVVIPNGADPVPDARADRRELLGDVPTMTFVGLLDYEPNTEAMEWFVGQVMPLILARRPDARVRIVGRGSSRISWVGDRPGVDLVGEVESVRPELDRADVSIVPINVGAGTRLKVIEAMAHHIPIVTTPVGCEGVDLRDGTDALIAQGPRSFADACLRMLADGELRQRTADSAAALFEDRYRWDVICDRVADLARSVVSGSVVRGGAAHDSG